MLRKLIEERQRRFAKLPFFQRLERPAAEADARAFVPLLTFFAMTFQDVLRLNEARVSDPALRVLAQQHRHEDRQHEQWLLRDLRRLGVEPPLEVLFGPRHAAARDASYAVASEVFRATDDRVRLALILVLESTGDVFFARVPRYMEELWPGGGDLEYFSRRHAAVEKGHTITENALAGRLDELTPPEGSAAEREALAMLERTFAAMTAMVESFEASIVGAALAAAEDPS
jgi:hypothetical protein